MCWWKMEIAQTNVQLRSSFKVNLNQPTNDMIFSKSVSTEIELFLGKNWVLPKIGFVKWISILKTVTYTAAQQQICLFTTLMAIYYVIFLKYTKCL